MVITSEITKAINSARIVADAVHEKYPKFSYNEGKGKNANGLYLKYDGEKLGDLWAFERNGDIVFHCYTYYLSDEDRANAINLPLRSPRGSYSYADGNVKVYNHHDHDETYKWEMNTTKEIFAELERIIIARTHIGMR